MLGTDPDAREEPQTMTATRWIYLMDESTLPEGAMKAAYPLGLNVIAARIGGTVRAFSGACPHLGCPLFTGIFSDGVLTCPCHDWRFDLRTGRFLDAPELGLKSYPVRSENGALLVGLE